MKIRRPLCAAGLAFAAAVAVMLLFAVRGAPIAEAPDKERVTVTGFVERIERRRSRDGTQTIITLSETAVLEESQIPVSEQFLSDSGKIPLHRLHRFWREKRESVRRGDAAEIAGILCYMGGNETPRMGSLITVEGDFRAFSHATNPGEFDAANYYRILGQQGRLTSCRIVSQSGSYDVFREKLYRFREYLSLLADASYGEKDASVVKAMLLGEKGTLDTDLKELYRQNGISHILAISGLHLSVIGMCVFRLLKKTGLPKIVYITITIGLMYCYGTMTGMGISMLRAYIMFGIRLCAELLGRTYDLLTAVTVAALAVLIRQPLYLQHSGFLFSFGAVCGIGIFLPAAQENLLGWGGSERADSRRGRAERAFVSGAAISLSTLPVYLCFYYEFPPYSVFLNLLVVPCMTFVLIGGLLSLAAAALFLPLGAAAAVPVHLILRFYEKCCDFCLRLPDSSWVTGCPKPWQTALFLGILTGLVAWNHRIPKLLFWQGALCALLALTIRLPRGLQITMVDVGQGDCIYLAEDSGVHMLIDGGSSDKSDVLSYQIMPFLKHEGVSYLDAIVVTHPDSDHISGIRLLLEESGTSGIAVGALYLPDVGEAGRNEAYRELERLAAEAGAGVRYLSAGDVLKCGKVMLTCLHPRKNLDETEPNAYSTVLYLTYGAFSALFTGDLEGAGEEDVAAALRRVQDMRGDGLHNITLLKVAHHGSSGSTGEAFLRQVDPEIALISSGHNNRYGHPHEELLARLRKAGCLILGTQESGAVTVRVRGGKVRVEEYLKNSPPRAVAFRAYR